MPTSAVVMLLLAVILAAVGAVWWARRGDRIARHPGNVSARSDTREPVAGPGARGEIYHVDTQFLGNALAVFENPATFEQRARSAAPPERAGNVATLVDALDLCNLLIQGDRIVFDSEVGGGRNQKVLDQIGRVAALFRDATAERLFRESFAGVAPASEAAAQMIQLRAARGAAAFFPRLARCATNVLDLFHLPHEPPTKPEEHLLPFVDARRQPSADEIAALEAKKEITGRRFYAALLTDDVAFRALCDARKQVELTSDVLAVLFMNFRLRLAEQRSIAREKVLVGDAAGDRTVADALSYLPAMGRRDFSREFSQFVRWGSDRVNSPGRAIDDGLREYVVENWADVGCQVQLSERRAIPIVVASVLGSGALKRSPRPETLLIECLRWKREHTKDIAAIRNATTTFQALGDEERKAKAAVYVAEILQSPSAGAARNRAVAEQISVRDRWLGLALRTLIDPLGTISDVALDSVDQVRAHFSRTRSPEYIAATHLSEAARPVLAGVDSQVRQRLIDIFGGTVLDARNSKYDPDRFPADPPKRT